VGITEHGDNLGPRFVDAAERIGGLPEPPSAELAQPEKARFRLFDSVASFVRRAAESQPLLIILDDLHAADPTSLMLLVAVSRQIRTMRATIVGTYREVEVKHLPELATLITEAEREGLVLPLRGLGETHISEFVERTWGVRAPSMLVHSLRDTTAGNPFFLHEVLRQMAADGSSRPVDLMGIPFCSTSLGASANSSGG
jgi:predicted ATPase